MTREETATYFGDYLSRLEEMKQGFGPGDDDLREAIETLQRRAEDIIEGRAGDYPSVEPVN